MILSYVTYGLLLVLLLWGGKFAHGENKFHEDSFSLEVTKCLRGFAAIGVILHHISQEGAFQWAGGGYNKPGELSIFVNAGFFFVAIFFFCSGFGLIKSKNSKPNYFEGFIKKRIVKTIVIPFYVNVILYAIFKVIYGYQVPVARWITDFIGLTLMNDYAWYPVVLTILYFAFYFIFKNIKNRKVCFLLMFVIIFLQGVFFCITGHFAWWAGPENWWLSDNFDGFKWWMGEHVIWFFGEWWVNSSIAFLIGMIFAQYEEKIKNWFKKCYVLKLIGIFILTVGFHFLSQMAQGKFGYWSEYNGLGPGILNKFICYLAQLPEVASFVILIYVIMYVYHVKNPVLKFFGNISYETYMMNYIAIIVFRFFLYSATNNEWAPFYKPYHTNLMLYEVCVIASTILLGFLFKWLNKMANKLIK